MNGQKGLFKTNIGRKNLMAVTGLFLSFFLIVHLLGNLTLLLPAEMAEVNFNEYSHFLGSLTIIKLVSFALYASIIIHAVDALLLTLNNKKTAGKNYEKFEAAASSKWYARSMGVLGTVLLVFIVLHMANFWAKYKLGLNTEGLELYTYADGTSNVNLYKLVVATFKMEWVVGVYVVSMIAMLYHLLHGVNSAFRSLGVYHKRWMGIIEFSAKAFAIVISLGFAVIPVFVYLYR
jgi:succinate dehydrogenase / fumarate reductase cytochrome b subunit